MKSRIFLLLSALPTLAWAELPNVILRHEFDNATLSLPMGQEGGVLLPGGGNLNTTSNNGGIPSGGGMQLRESVFGLPAGAFLSPHEEFANQVLFTSGLNGAPAVYLKLYPEGYKNGGIEASRSQIQSGNSVFRYKWLMYGQDPGGTPAILNLFEQTFGDTDDADNPWFNDNDRIEADKQIQVLREALAYSPLDRQLQDALLDIYYDLAVAEMQFVRKRQAKLATLRLGLELDPAKPFIIDQEIETYEKLVEITDGILAKYGDLLSLEMQGFNPGDIDPTAGGAPFGYWLFQQKVPSRSQVETDLGSSPGPGVVKAVARVATFRIPGDNNDFTITAPKMLPGEMEIELPDPDGDEGDTIMGSDETSAKFLVELTEGSDSPSYDVPTKTLNLPVVTDVTTLNALISRFNNRAGFPAFAIANADGNDGSSVVAATMDIEPLNTDKDGPTAVFDGYKDFRTLLTILGQNMQFRAELAELLGKRRANGDLSTARELLTEAQGPLASDFDALRRMFGSIDFDLPAYTGTGVRGSLTLVKNATTRGSKVRGMLNGTTNMIGVDPDFLLLVKPKVASSGKFDTYDILADRISDQDSPTKGPLAVAVIALAHPTTGAIATYNTLRGSIDDVEKDLDTLEDEFGLRLEEITGFTTEDRASQLELLPALPKPWDGSFNPEKTSKLKSVQTTIDSLRLQTANLGQLTQQLLQDVANAKEAVRLADNIDNTITGAEADYLDEVASAWTEIHVWAGLAAGAQAGAETAFGVAGGSDFISKAVAGGAGAYNTVIQTTAATRTSMREEEKEKAELGFQTKIALAGQPLTVKQAQLDLGGLMRETYKNFFDIQSNFAALAQAVAEKAGLIREVEQLSADLDADRNELSDQYFADPIHFVRAEGALLRADAEFRRAQLWTFYTARALEYKWQERFSYADAVIGETYDIGSIISARNATELEQIVIKMGQFDGDRNASSGTPVDSESVISMRDLLLTPNPDDVNRSFLPVFLENDKGLRFDPQLGRVVTKIERFRNILTALKAQNPVTGQLVIPFDTTQLAGYDGLFKGPNYDNRTDPDVGFYRDKISWIGINIIATNGSPPGDTSGNRTATLRYGGTMYFRTRVAPCWTRAPGNVAGLGGGVSNPKKDFRGEFIITPFRYYQDEDYTGEFKAFNSLIMPGIKTAYSSDSATTSAVRNQLFGDIIGVGSTGYRRQDFKELSVAATNWSLEFSDGQFDINNIDDIELIIYHNSYARPQITCPADPNLPADPNP